MKPLVHLIVDRPYEEVEGLKGDFVAHSDDLRVVVIEHGKSPSDVLRLDGAAKRWPEGGVPSMNPYIFYADVVELVTGHAVGDVSLTVSPLTYNNLDQWEARQAKVVTI